MGVVNTKSGKKVEVGETTGLDEILVTKMLGSNFTANPSGAFLYRMSMAMASIKSIDDKPVARPKKAEDVEVFWAGFSSKDKAKIEREYSRLNELTDEDEEVKNSESPQP